MHASSAYPILLYITHLPSKSWRGHTSARQMKTKFRRHDSALSRCDIRLTSFAHAIVPTGIVLTGIVLEYNKGRLNAFCAARLQCSELPPNPSESGSL